MAAVRTRSGTAIVVVALSGLFLQQSPVVDAHTFSAKSTVSIRFEEGKFKGRVRSARNRCVRHRLVGIWKARPDQPDLKIVQKRTGRRGKYAVAKPAGVRGKFYARAVKVSTGDYPHAHRCRRAISRVIKAP